METTLPTSPQLDYAPPIPWRRKLRSRRWALRALIAVVLLGLVAAAPSLWRRAQLVYWQRQCMSYTPAPEQLAFERDPARPQHIIEEFPSVKYDLAGTSLEPGTYFTLPAWERFYELAGGGLRSNGTLFVHRRTSPRGNTRLVAVDLVRAYASGELITAARVFSLGGLYRPPRELTAATIAPNAVPLNRPDAKIVRVFVGTPDPSDPSHFTIDYELDGQRHTLDGWLRDDDTVVIESRD